MGLNNGSQFRANGTIGPSRFVIQDSTADNMVIEAGGSVTTTANGGVAITGTKVPVLGVSQVGQKRTPGLVGSDVTIAAQAGDVVDLFFLGDVCSIQLAGTVVRGDLLSCNGTTDGRAIGINFTPGTFGGVAVGAKALMSGTANQLILCQIVSFYI